MKQKQESKQELTLADLQLYLAGALPWYRTLLLRGLLLVSGTLRGRLAEVRKENQLFRNREYPRLREKLPGVTAAGQAGRQGVRTSTETDNGHPFRLPGTRSLQLAAGLAVMLMLGVGVFLPLYMNKSRSEPVFYAAKGTSLGVHVYVKSGRTRRVDGFQAGISLTDTLQVVPVGRDKQQLIIFGWDRAEGLSRLFPESGAVSAPASADLLPPGLVLDEAEDLKLICVTSSGNFTAARIRAILSEKPFFPMEEAPASLLDNNVYIQVYSLSME